METKIDVLYLRDKAEMCSLLVSNSQLTWSSDQLLTPHYSAVLFSYLKYNKHVIYFGTQPNIY